MKKILAFIALLGTIAVIAYGQNQKASDQGAASGTAIPSGTVMPFAGSSAPSGWVLSYGQELSSTTYAKLYAVLGATYCTADHGGGCTGGFFRVPDLRGRVLAGKDNMGGTAASRITVGSTIDGTVLGKAGGAQAQASNVAVSAQPTFTVNAHTHNASSMCAGVKGISGTNFVFGEAANNCNGESWTANNLVSAGVAGASSSWTSGITVVGITTSASVNTTSRTADVSLTNNSVNNLQPVNIINYIIKL
jgi:microcystin-dependent protein